MSPLDATLVTLVPAAGAFVLLRWLARRRGALPLPRTLVLAEVAALALLVPAALALEPLGLVSLAPWVAAGLFAVLGCHALAELAALRPLLDDSGRRPGPSWLFVALPFLVYAATLPWVTGMRPPDGDEPYYLLVAHSLAEDFDTDLADEYAERSYHAFTPRTVDPQPGDPRGEDGEIYSRHDPLLPAVLAPALGLGGRFGALLMMGLLAALAAWATLRLARVVFPEQPVECLWAYGLFALTPPMLIYAHQVWTEVPAAALAAWALGSILRAFPDPDADPVALPRRTWRTWADLTLALVLLPVLKLRFLPIAGGLVLVLIHRVWRRRRQGVEGVGGAEARVVGVVLVALAAACAALLLANLHLFGRALKITTPGQLADQFFAPVSFVRGSFGLFWDLGFGLFGTAPIWLILIPALVLVLTRRDLRHRLGPALLLVAGPTLLLVAPRTEWFGGFSPPFRYALVVLPLAAVALVPTLARRHRSGPRAVLACLGVATALLALLWLAVPGWTFDVADGGSHLVDRLEVSLAADVGRLLPSYTRPRLASWLWPPLSALVVVFAWRWPWRRDRQGNTVVSPALPTLVGLTVLAVSLAALPAAGRLLPTRVVEFEDPWVTHRGGHLYPEPWTMARVKYTGGWVLRPGESVQVPAVPGGGAAELRARLLFVDNGPAPFTVVVRVGGEEVARWRERPEPWSDEIDTDERWEERRAAVSSWPQGAALEIFAEGTSPDGVLLDRLEIAWR